MGEYILTSDMNNLYNPIFCKLLFNTNNDFLQYKNANFGPDFTYDTSKKEFHVSKNIPNENECLNECKTKDINWCTSYSYNAKTKECIKYSNYPLQIINNVDGINSGYNINKKYNYNDLNDNQKTNVKKRCFNEYLNNVYTPNYKNIDLTSCLSSFSDNSNNTIVNYDKECLFNTYNSSNAVNLISNNIYSYTDNSDFTRSIPDTNIDIYKSLHDTYMTNKETINNINNTLSEDDVPINIDKNLYDKYISEINKKKDKMNQYSYKIINRSSNENFENQNINYFYKNYIKFIVFLIVFFILLFLIVYIINKLFFK